MIFCWRNNGPLVILVNVSMCTTVRIFRWLRSNKKRGNTKPWSRLPFGLGPRQVITLYNRAGHLRPSLRHHAMTHGKQVAQQSKLDAQCQQPSCTSISATRYAKVINGICASSDLLYNTARLTFVCARF